MKKEACSVNKTICIILILLTLQIILLSCRGISVIEDGSNPETAEETVAETVTDKETPDITDKTEIADNTDHRFDWQYDVPLYYPEEEEIQGDYIFNSSENGSVDLVLKRNVHTGECTTVCNDPFCTHDNPSCRFYISLYVVGIG